MAKKYYAVVSGRKPGIYTDWDTCYKQVNGFAGAKFKGFDDMEDVKQFFRSAGIDPAPYTKAMSRPRASLANIPSQKPVRQLANQQVIDGQGIGAPDPLYVTDKREYLPAGDYVIYTDGGCAFNPDGPGGIGIVIINADTGERWTFSEGYRSTTNNRMEVTAAITALRHIPDGCFVSLYSDSKYVLNTIDGLWQKKKNKDLWELLDVELGRLNIFTEWVKGHNGTVYNEQCDELATQAMNQPFLKEDSGYAKQKEDGRNFYAAVERLEQDKPKTVSGNPADKIPPELNGDIPSLRAKDLAAEKDIHLSCAKLICEFYAYGNRKFTAYVKLKTGGRDKYSSLPKEFFVGQYGQAAWELAEAAVGDKVITAMRWHARGLLLSDAIRKVQVDTEVSQNCMS